METINWILLFALVAITFALLATVLGRKGRVYEYPFFAGAMFFSFVLPQLPGLAGDPYLPEGAFAKTMVVTLSCAVMLWLGWTISNRPMRAFSYEMSEQRLITAAAVLSALGGFFYFKISHLPVEVRDLSLPTGLPVAYNFFAKMLGYGFALATICFVRTRSRVALAIALFGATFYLERIILAGRRGDTSEFVLIILLSHWFERGRTVPRALALVAVLVGTLVMNSTGDYRKVAKTEEGPSLDRVMQIDFVGNIKDLLANGGPGDPVQEQVGLLFRRRRDRDAGAARRTAPHRRRPVADPGRLPAALPQLLLRPLAAPLRHLPGLGPALLPAGQGALRTHRQSDRRG